MGSWLKVLYAALIPVVIVAHFVVANLLMVMSHQLGLLTYPLHFGFNMFLVGVILLVLWPRHKAKIEAPAAFDKYLTVDERRLSGSFWTWVRRKGIGILAAVAAIVLGPMFAALVLRYFKTPEYQVWLYSFLATLAATAVWVSVFLGAGGLISSFFANLVA